MYCNCNDSEVLGGDKQMNQGKTSEKYVDERDRWKVWRVHGSLGTQTLLEGRGLCKTTFHFGKV